MFRNYKKRYSMNARVTFNTNETKYTDPSYKGLPVIQTRGPLVERYLEQIFNTIACSINQQARTFATRFELLIPQSTINWDSSLISRFIDFLKYEIKKDLKRRCINPANCQPRFAWAKERESSHNYHYHVLLILNKDCYFRSGRIDSDNDNLAMRIQRSWSKALDMDEGKGRGLVHFPANRDYILDNRKPEFLQQLSNLFHRASYLAKEETKPFNDGTRHFSCSHLTPLPYGFDLEEIINFHKVQFNGMNIAQYLNSTDLID